MSQVLRAPRGSRLIYRRIFDRAFEPTGKTRPVRVTQCVTRRRNCGDGYPSAPPQIGHRKKSRLGVFGRTDIVSAFTKVLHSVRWSSVAAARTPARVRD